MPKFRCEQCRQKIAAPDDYAGKRVRCPRCKQAIRVPVVEVPEPAMEGAPAPPAQAHMPSTVATEAAVRPSAPSTPFADAQGGEIFAHRNQADYSSLFADDERSAKEGDVAPEEMTQPVWHTQSVAEYHDPGPHPAEGHGGFVSQPIEPPALGPTFEQSPAFAADTAPEAESPAPPPAPEPVVIEPTEVIDAPTRRQGPPLTSVDEVADLLRRLDRPGERARLAAEHVAREKQNAPRAASGAVAVLSWLAAVIALGAIACCFVPNLARFVIAAGAFGLLLSIAALVLAVGRRARLLVSVGGAFASAGAIVLAILVGRGLLFLPQTPRIPAGGSAAPVRLAANVRPANSSDEGGRAAPAPAEYVLATSPLIAGDVEVRIVSVAILRPAVYSGNLSSVTTPDERRLQITVELKTVDAGPVMYDPWRRVDASDAQAKVTDASGEILPLDERPYAGGDHLVILAAGALRHPVPLDAAPKQDVLLFDQPTDPAGDLRLDLTGRNIGAPDTVLHVLIPAAMVRVQP